MSSGNEASGLSSICSVPPSVIFAAAAAADVAGGAADGAGLAAGGSGGLGAAGTGAFTAATDAEPRDGLSPGRPPGFTAGTAAELRDGLSTDGRTAAIDAELRAEPSDDGRGGGTAGGGSLLSPPVAPTDGSGGRGGGRLGRGGALGAADALGELPDAERDGPPAGVPPFTGEPGPPLPGSRPGFNVGDSLSEGGIVGSWRRFARCSSPEIDRYSSMGSHGGRSRAHRDLPGKKPPGRRERVLLEPATVNALSWIVLVGVLLFAATVAAAVVDAVKGAYPIQVARRYLGSKKRASISVGTSFAILGVALGVAALVTVMSVTGGFQKEFRDKVLGVNAHVLILKYSTDFREYRTIMEKMKGVQGVRGMAPFSINPMMLTHGEATATGVLLKGVDPQSSLGVGAPPGTVPVLDLPKHIKVGSIDGLRHADAKPAERRVPGSEITQEPPPDLDAGVEERDDAGRNISLIRRLQKDLEERERNQAAAPDAGAPDPAAAPSSSASAAPAKSATGSADAGAPDPAAAGTAFAMEPDGGYKSKLPEDDDLPADVDPDECSDPAKVAQMPGIVVGVSLAKTLALELDDCVTVTSPTIGFSFSGGSLKPPVAKRFRVIAMFEAGFDQYDSKLVYTDLFEAQTFYDHGDTVTGIEMIVDDIDQADEIAKEMDTMLPGGLYHTMDWEELNHGLFTALKIQQWGMSIVLALIILVAAFTVVATLIMVVLDKKKEISVMKAMGATNYEILRIFFYQGWIIGVLGTTLGLLLGIVVCKGLLVYSFPLDPKVYFVSHLPVSVQPLYVLGTGVIAIGICMVATLAPSLYAATIVPAEGFREQ
jgi:lipoprotein-releasing system permease protein